MLIWGKAEDILLGDSGSLLGDRLSVLKGKLGLSAWVLERGQFGAEPLPLCVPVDTCS